MARAGVALLAPVGSGDVTGETTIAFYRDIALQHGGAPAARQGLLALPQASPSGSSSSLSCQFQIPRVIHT